MTRLEDSVPNAAVKGALLSERLRVFVSSVQKEMEDERLVVQQLLSTDFFLAAHCDPVLYELEPAAPEKAVEGCIATLDSCQVYLLIVGSKYGSMVGSLSITHTEFQRAKKLKLPVLAFIKGDDNLQREEGTRKLLAELQSDGTKYKRFGNVIELQKEVRAALVKLLRNQFGVAPSTDEDQIATQTIEATSAFESQPLERLRWQDLDLAVARRLIASAEQRDEAGISEQELVTAANVRGLVWRDSNSGEAFATGAGIVLLAKDPSAVFPQCRVLADAYSAREPDGNPRDHEDIRAPAPLAIERAIQFIDRNTRHPMRVVGLNRVRLDEYPISGLREALVNAVAHRQYEDAGRKIMLEVFPDRIVVSSPGLPPAPLTLATLRKGKYRPCSRNPVLAQCLSYFHRIEERGSGFRRMADHMLDHGLERPLLGTDTGYFQVTFGGPGENLERLRVPENRLKVTPAIAAQLNERQRGILAQALKAGFVTRRWCVSRFDVAADTAGRDLKALMDAGILAAKGKGRSVSYYPRLPESTDNRPTVLANRPTKDELPVGVGPATLGKSTGNRPTNGRNRPTARRPGPVTTRGKRR